MLQKKNNRVYPSKWCFNSVLSSSEMTYQSQHCPEQTIDILDDVKKGIKLNMMSEESISARISWETFDGLLRQ